MRPGSDKQELACLLACLLQDCFFRHDFMDSSFDLTLPNARGCFCPALPLPHLLKLKCRLHLAVGRFGASCKSGCVAGEEKRRRCQISQEATLEVRTLSCPLIKCALLVSKSR